MTKEQLEALLKGFNDRLDTIEKSKTGSEIADLAAILKGSVGTSGNSVNSDEYRCLKAFGVESLAELIHVNTGHPDFKHVPMELKALALNAKMRVNTSRFIMQQFHGEQRDVIGQAGQTDRIAKVKGMTDGSYYGKHVLAPTVKAFSSTGAGAGDEYVPTMLASFFIEEFELARLVEGLFEDVTMPSQPYEIPVATDFTEARAIAENAAITDNRYNTSKISLNATKFGEYYLLPEEFIEDSAPNVYAMGTRQVVDAQHRAIEQAIINGDTAGTHMDSDTAAGAANLAAKQFDGLRKLALGNSANGVAVNASNTNLTDLHLSQVTAGLGDQGVDPSSLVYIFGSTIYQQAVRLPTVQTVDKYGPAATVISGELAKYAGKPIIISKYCRENLNATGVYDATTTDRAAVLIVNKKRWWTGTRRPIVVQIQRDLANYDRWMMASYARRAFKGLSQGAKEKGVGIIFNIKKN